MKTRWIVLGAALIAFSACSSTHEIHLGESLPSPSPTETPEPPKPTPPPTFWGCKISNGAGRIFRGIGDSLFEAREDALHPCERQYRHCFLLDCQSGVSPDFKP